MLEKIVEALKSVRGLEAVVLGGSRARGTHGPDSDVDIGLYYAKEAIDLPLLRKIVQELDQEHREQLLAAPGEWGKWMDGGCWLTIDGQPVDFILREVSRVEKAVQECQEGIVAPHYQTGHPHAYFNVMYAGELAICKILWHKNENICKLKSLAENYPPKLKEQIIYLFSFEMGFSLMLAERNLARDDIYYVTGHLVRSVSTINQVLFALNEQYCINEKKAVKMVDSFSIRPAGYKQKVDTIFSLVGTDLPAACTHLKKLIEEVNALL